MNRTVNIIDCKYFTTNIIELDQAIIKDYSLIDSFVIYICVHGSAMLEWEDKSINLVKGETVLIPALMEGIGIRPAPAAKILEVYIRENFEK